MYESKLSTYTYVRETKPRLFKLKIATGEGEGKI